MTTEADINLQVDNLYKNFWMSPYDGEPLPEGFIAKFREAIMYQTLMNLQGAPEVLLELLNTKEEDLKTIHVGIIFNTLFNTPFNAIFVIPEQALNAVIEYKEFEKKWNIHVEKKQKVIEGTRQRLLVMSGITNKTVNMNGTLRKN